MKQKLGAPPEICRIMKKILQIYCGTGGGRKIEKRREKVRGDFIFRSQLKSLLFFPVFYINSMKNKKPGCNKTNSFFSLSIDTYLHCQNFYFSSCKNKQIIKSMNNNLFFTRTNLNTTTLFEGCREMKGY